MDKQEQEKLECIAKQARNIRIMIVQMSAGNSDGDRIPGTEHDIAIIYNQETISEHEVIDALNDGSYEFDERIITSYPQQVQNIFPHSRESDHNDVYWNRQEDRLTCKCSSCGFSVSFHEAMEFDRQTCDYTKIRYRFCPNCGSFMTKTETKENGVPNNGTLLVKIYGQQEYKMLLGFLNELNYHWKSGQCAAKPPFFFKNMTDAENNDVAGIRTLDLDKKNYRVLSN